jgi:aminoglycoside phosphotransferase (APT) family kinase protein
MSVSAGTISSDDIVTLQRLARFGDISNEEWGRRLVSLISDQPEVLGNVDVSNVRPVETRAGGSNGTLLFEAAFDDQDGRRTGEYVLRFLPVRGLFHTYDVSRQFELQRALAGTDVPVAPQVWLDAEGAHLKTAGYVMGRVRGVSPPMGWRASGLFAEASPADRRAMMFEQIHVLAKIHDVDWRRLGLGWLEQRATGDRPMQREVNWYWDSLTWAGATEYVAKLAPIREWLIENEPTDVDVVLCHGDINYGNYIYEGVKVTGVVDWEMAYLGAPEGDLVARQSSDVNFQSDVEWPEGAPSHEEMFAEYERISGRKLRHLDYFRLFCAYRSVVITVLALGHFPEAVRASFLPHLQHFETAARELLENNRAAAPLLG